MASRPEYTEDPVVKNDEDYYRDLCQDEKVKVVMMEGKGKGVISMANYNKDDLVISETALCCAQNLDETMGKSRVKCCAMTLSSLETPMENLSRVAPSLKIALPMIDEYPKPKYVKCDNHDKECSELYSSTAKKSTAWVSFHGAICRGLMTPRQKTAYLEYAQEDWIQGGIDYSDTFNLALHIFVCHFTLLQIAVSFNRK